MLITEAQLRESNEEKGVLSEQVRVYYHLLCSGMWGSRSQLSGCKAAQCGVALHLLHIIEDIIATKQCNCILQLEALKTAMRQMAEDKDAASAKALAPLQQQLQVIPNL